MSNNLTCALQYLSRLQSPFCEILYLLSVAIVYRTFTIELNRIHLSIFYKYFQSNTFIGYALVLKL